MGTPGVGIVLLTFHCAITQMLICCAGRTLQQHSFYLGEAMPYQAWSSPGVPHMSNSEDAVLSPLFMLIFPQLMPRHSPKAGGWDHYFLLTCEDAEPEAVDCPKRAMCR